MGTVERYRVTGGHDTVFITCPTVQRSELKPIGERTMINGKIMTLELTRLEMCDLLIATTNIVIEARTEQAAAETSETRKEILTGTIAKWKTLHDKIAAQIAAFDEEQEKDQ